MNLTIPIRAENSSSSLSRGIGGNSSIVHPSRLILSIVTTGIVVSALAVGSVGGIMQSASAQLGPMYRQNERNYGGESNDGPQEKTSPAISEDPVARSPGASPEVPATTDKTVTEVTPVQTPTPAQTPTQAPATTVTPKMSTPATTPTPAPATATTTPSAPAPATATTVVVNPPVQVAPVTTVQPAATDTAPAIAAMAQAQALTNSQPVTYTSARLPDAARDRLVLIAAIAAITGGLLYTMSFIGGTPLGPKQGIPIRYIVPVREVSSY